MAQAGREGGAARERDGAKRNRAAWQKKKKCIVYGRKVSMWFDIMQKTKNREEYGHTILVQKDEKTDTRDLCTTDPERGKKCTKFVERGSSL